MKKLKADILFSMRLAPGYAFNVVTHGTLTVEDGCGGEQALQSTDNATNPANPSFEETDGGVHRAKNLGTEDVVVLQHLHSSGGTPDNS
jgi:hypothetical protein